jgi:hypothetical protein
VLQQDLNEAVDWYTNDMATKNYYGGTSYCAQFNKTAHCDSLGRMPPERAQAFGYPQGVGENSAAGFTSAQSVFDAWKGSGGHNSNMLNSSYRSIGVSRTCKSGTMYGCYWVTDFGYYTGPGSPPGPSSTSVPNPTATPPADVVNCDDFATQQQAQNWMNAHPGDPDGLDGNGNGIACENLPCPCSNSTATQGPTPAPTPTPAAQTPAPTSTPEPTLATNLWEDINCDGSVTPHDAVDLMRDKLGFDAAAASNDGCPEISQVIEVDGALRVWGDTDCSADVVVLDSIKLLAFLAGVPFDDIHANCPEPGTEF